SACDTRRWACYTSSYTSSYTSYPFAVLCATSSHAVPRRADDMTADELVGGHAPCPSASRITWRGVLRLQVDRVATAGHAVHGLLERTKNRAVALVSRLPVLPDKQRWTSGQAFLVRGVHRQHRLGALSLWRGMDSRLLLLQAVPAERAGVRGSGGGG